MKSTEFITEGVAYDHQKMLELIKHDCRPYLMENKHSLTELPLWRGMNSGKDGDNHAHGKYQKRNVRLDGRIPRDAPQDVHDTLNYIFNKKYGAQYRNALFATGKKSNTYDYGQEFIIFPIGNYDYIWSEEVTDLWRKIATDLKIAHASSRTQMSQEQENALERMVYGLNYKKSNLEGAIASGHEIMMRCKSYYAIDFNIYQLQDRKIDQEFLNA